MKMISTKSHASIGTSFATAAQPSAGGIAPDRPPMTMFCDVFGLSSSV